MLCELFISNLALVEELRLSFHPGLTVLTGETGAGKSLILQAIHLLAGGRAGRDWIRSGAEQAAVEALFEVGRGREQIKELFAELGVALADELVIRRVMQRSGRSRYYLNDSLVTGVTAGQVMERLLNVASQHEHQQLLKPRYHLDVLDTLGSLWESRRTLADQYDEWRKLVARCEEIEQREKERARERDLLEFQVKEISEAGLTIGEEQGLLEERDRLKSAETLLRLGNEGVVLLEETVLPALGMARKQAEQISALDSSASGLADELANGYYQVEEAFFNLRRYVEQVVDDPARLEEVTARIDLIQKLKRKYGETVEEIIAFGEQAARQLQELDVLEERKGELAARKDQVEQSLRDLAGELSEKRRATATSLAVAVQEELKQLAMEQARFDVEFEGPAADLAHLTRSGWDRPEFVFSANPGEPLKSLAKVASGGELSRLMLALRCLLASRDQVETVVFDEVDAGISGKAAEQVARKMRELARHHQVLCITHLPQIAACADDHFLVEKRVEDERTKTLVSPLPKEERARELARMLDGESVTKATMAYVQELMARRNEAG